MEINEPELSLKFKSIKPQQVKMIVSMLKQIFIKFWIIAVFEIYWKLKKLLNCKYLINYS